jgi:hypothetical protein
MMMNLIKKRLVLSGFTKIHSQIILNYNKTGIQVRLSHSVQHVRIVLMMVVLY